jgi:hypothetical protein
MHLDSSVEVGARFIDENGERSDRHGPEGKVGFVSHCNLLENGIVNT